MVWVLPVGLCAAILAALTLPDLGVLLHGWGLVPGLVALIFLISGLQTRAGTLRLEPRFGRTLASAALISLLLSPLLGWLLARYGGLAPDLALGLLVMALAPPTLSSCVVLTGAAGGKSLWALFMTLGLNLLGIFSIPLLLTLLVGDTAGFSPWALLWQLLSIVLLPFLCGLLLRPLVPGGRWRGGLNQVPTLCVVLTVWMTLSHGRELLLQLSLAQLAGIGALALLLHLTLMGLALLAALGLGLEREEGYALLFTAAQKTLPVAVSVLVGLGVPTGVAVISCILFHFGQLMLDSMLVVPLRRRTAPRG